MAYSLENTTDLTNLGNSIRAKTSTTATMTVAEMATAVASITSGGSGGGGWTPTTVTDITDQAENGKYDASIDLTIHSLSPYIVIAVGGKSPDDMNGGPPTLVAIGYFDGTQCILLYGVTGGSDYSSVSFSQHLLSFEIAVTNLSRYAKYFLIT